MNRTNLLDGLNEAQREAVVNVDGPMLILAGPGSGKTRVISHRIAYLVSSADVHAYRIVAVTFTNKAAREMRERVRALLGEVADEVMLGTFHSVCSRILRVDGPRGGVGRGFVIYDDSDQISVMNRALVQLNIDTKRFNARSVLSAISKAKNELASPAAYARGVRDYFGEVVSRCYERYQSLLQENNALDFDDLIMRTVTLFRENEEVLQKYAGRFLHVLVDEFQDTNVAQYVLARQLASGHGNICVVGDPDQSIYAWRSADIRNILNFERDYPNARVVYLSRNYRSTQNILDSAHAVISINTQRKENELWTDAGPGEPIVVQEGYNQEEEAELVVREVEALVGRGVRHGDIAVMYRTNAQSRPLEEVFVREAIPYRLVGGTRFYERREIKDLVAYLRLIDNPLDSISLRRVVGVPNRGIGGKSLSELDAWASRQGLRPYEAMRLVAEQVMSPEKGGLLRHPLSAAPAKALAAFVGIIEGLRAEAEETTVSGLVGSIIEKTGYARYLFDHFTEDGEERWENVQELMSVAADYDALLPEVRLSSFLEDVALVSDVDEYESGVDAVTLITLHQAKGLEFRVVFMVGMEEGLLPHMRSYDDPSQMEEERRLCYVGMTRAKERLYMLRAFRRMQSGMSVHNPPSRFLKDLPGSLVARQEASHEEVAPAVSAHRLHREERERLVDAVAFTAGARVRHERFGDGVVVSCDARGDDYEVVVAFKSGAGVKKLLLSFARLEPVEC